MMMTNTPAGRQSASRENTAQQQKPVTGKGKKSRRLSRAELDQQAWQRKQQKKRRGNPPGSRTNPQLLQPVAPVASATKDPRIGSKKPVPLLDMTTSIAASAPSRKTATPVTAPLLSAQQKRHAEQELQQLENDPQLNTLLDQLEAGAKLSDPQQSWLDNKLARIEQLMQQLQINVDDMDNAEQGDEINEPPAEDLMRLLKNTR